MRIIYDQGEPNEILSNIQEQLGGRKLGKLLHFDLDSDTLDVTIKKMGTSKLSFTQTKLSSGLEWELTDEKIALSHKAFKGDVLKKLTKVIELTGGQVEED